MTEPAFHTILLLDCSTSVRRLKDTIIAGANQILDALRPGNGLVSVVFFNRDLGILVWRVSVSQAPRLTAANYPIDAGTALYDAIVTTVAKLTREHNDSHREINAAGDVKIFIFTDGMDSSSEQANLMQTRLAINTAREHGWGIAFVSNVEGLAGDLGLHQRESIRIELSPQSMRAGFTRATSLLHPGLITPPPGETKPEAPPTGAPPDSPAQL